ncbi:MAG: 4-alpha-glucanotransferase, partial [Christensenellaceae bacterium]
MEQTRIAGILMPISSLPSAEGIGTFGKGAYEFVDFLKRSGMALWQVLPLVPTGYGDSPYQSCCADAMNAYFIDMEMLAEQGLLTKEEIASAEGTYDERRVDYGMLFHAKNALLKRAFSAFDRNDEGFLAYLAKGEAYDYALFMTLKKKFGQKCWVEWESPYRKYDETVLADFAKVHEDEMLFWQFTQYIASKQWFALKEYANRNGVRIMGDIPLYVAYDSVEMWKYGEKLFQVDADGNPSSVAGVPPDAFSKDGQLWGNPLYDWEKMKKDGYAWWNQRIYRTLELFDMVRIDHFRGFDRYFAVPAKEKTAKNGVWMDGPKDALFRDKKGYAIVAEDLGIIDEGVVSLLKKTGYPGMKVL